MVTSKIPADATRYSRTDALMSAIGATLLIVTEMLGAVFALAWAVAGLVGFGETATYVLMAVFGIPGLIGSLALTRRVLRVEATLRNMPTA
jgi:hypothetical protein